MSTAAFVAAGAGAAVAKHGNRGVSSKSGSADVLAMLSVKTDYDPPSWPLLDDIGVAACSPTCSSAMARHAIRPRREIGIRTLFNILGLTNPAGSRRSDARGLQRHAAAAGGRRLPPSARSIAVVRSSDGLDEITTTRPSTVAEVTPAGVSVGILDRRIERRHRLAGRTREGAV
ncbi:MAG: hypothetical protein U1F87_04525 [Kiritimatiellia bacterium]